MPHEYLWRKFKDFMKYRVLHVNDTPHQIALGAAIAVFVAWTPTLGVQTVLAFFLAALFRANKAITIPAVWVSNPVTMAPLFWCNWKLGVALVGAPSDGVSHLLFKSTETASLATALGHLFDPRYWVELSGRLLSLGAELWVGSLILGIAAAIIAYAGTYVAVHQYRLRRRPDLLPRVREAGKKLATAARQRALHKKQTNAA